MRFNNQADQKAARLEIESILERNGVLTAEDVFEAAKMESSSLHRYFEWDERKAWIECNLQRARSLIRDLSTDHRRVVGGLATSVSVRDYSFSDRLDGYIRTIDALKRKDTRAELLSKALWELDAFRAKYSALRELADLHDFIDETLKKLGKYAARTA